MIKDGQFPAQVKLSQRSSAWLHSEVIAWKNARTAERDSRERSEVVAERELRSRSARLAGANGRFARASAGRSRPCKGGTFESHARSAQALRSPPPENEKADPDGSAFWFSGGGGGMRTLSLQASYKATFCTIPTKMPTFTDGNLRHRSASRSRQKSHGDQT
ncbi:helix-turn-helix transcriptional regulator [Massilia horti]|uniref:AlpA family phage regulatory protein n=1 Tax=Massilia horti TaxID=2562153 RepID=A0A4Y9T0M3_9BURK|nr:AlpA family phage regulatory protein [Massilia horti]